MLNERSAGGRPIRAGILCALFAALGLAVVTDGAVAQIQSGCVQAWESGNEASRNCTAHSTKNVSYSANRQSCRFDLECTAEDVPTDHGDITFQRRWEVEHPQPDTSRLFLCIDSPKVRESYRFPDEVPQADKIAYAASALTIGIGGCVHPEMSLPDAYADGLLSDASNG